MHFQEALLACLLLTLVLRDVYSVGPAVPSYSTTLESELRTELFTDYEVLQRPNQTVSVRVALNLFTVNSLDIKDQILSTSGFFAMTWTDGRLAWNNMANYSNIRFLFSNENYMWRPTIVVENSVSNLEVFSDENILIRIQSQGYATWTPGGIFETNCYADITYYPLDTQECSITLTTWAYTSNEVTLHLADEPFILDSFSENGEWSIIETSTSETAATRAKDMSNSYSRLYFTFKLKRRPLFHILNTIIPVLLMASLIVFVFKLPPESGERVGMSLTVLLAYAVYLTLISDNIPQTSLSASILSTYLTIILMLSTLSVIFTIVVLDIYFNHDDDEDPPSWIQTLTRNFLVKMSMWKGTSCCKKQKVQPRDEKIVTSSCEKLRLEDAESDSNIPTRKTDQTGNTENEGEEKKKLYSWKEVALIIDRCFMYIFIFLTVVVTVVCLSILASKY